ncbi:MAG: asparagine synthase-related protein, partial [Verrucomicrobiota bacterium]
MSAIYGMACMEGQMVDPEQLKKMGSALAHRGRDGHGCWSNKMVGLGRHCVWTTPESCIEPPVIHSSDGRFSLVADCRIDNRKELAPILGIKRSSARTDGEFILEAWRKWGRNCPRHLLGDFAFALWDNHTATLFCVTDPLGIRPLHYAVDKEKRFLFSTEIRNLHEGGCDKNLNYRSLWSCVYYPQALGRESNTFFEGIEGLLPGHLLTFQGGLLNRLRYWSFRENRQRWQFRGSDECLEAIRDQLSKAVHARLRSQFPVATSLSGGLDSSAILAAANRSSGNQSEIIAFAAILPRQLQGKLEDEKDYVDLFKKDDAVKVHYVEDPVDGPFDHLESVTLTSPRITSRHFLYHSIAMAAEDAGARVLLEGIGGELGITTHGKGIFPELFLTGKWQKLARELLAKSKVENQSLVALVRNHLLRPLLPPLFMRLAGGSLLRHDIERFKDHSIINTDWLGAIAPIDRARVNENIETMSRVPVWHRRHELASLEMFFRPRRDELYKGYEKITHSFPLADRRLLEICLEAPLDAKHNDGYARYPVRGAMNGLLPEKIRWRTDKQPFSPDYHVRFNRQRASVLEVNVCCDLGMYNVCMYIGVGGLGLKGFLQVQISCQIFV